MKLAEKIRYLREVEGSLRGLDRAMTQQELVRAIAEETRGKGISQSYLSQIESGARPHLTNTTRLLLARFFKVHPGYLVEDPENFQAELRTVEILEDSLTCGWWPGRNASAAVIRSFAARCWRWRTTRIRAAACAARVHPEDARAGRPA